MPELQHRVAAELKLPVPGVRAVVRLLEEGATVPFVARYRKEATGGLDEVQIRDIAERRAYLQQLDARRETILRSIDEQGKLTDDLRRRLDACRTKVELEDLYLPYKAKRRTKASVAQERGLGPLAERILDQPERGSPEEDARRFVDRDKGVANVDQALAGARDILVETVAEHAPARAFVREALEQYGTVTSKAVKARTAGRTKFEDYYDYSESLRRIASHRYLALRRGETQGVLRVKVELDEERCVARLERILRVRPGSPYARRLQEAIREAYRRRLHPTLEKEVRGTVAERAEREAINVFADNLRNLLLAAPFGSRPVIAIDPGIRTGCKCVALTATGRVEQHTTVYLQRSEPEHGRAERALLDLVERHAPRAVAVGNGTGGREAEQFVRAALKRAGISIPVVSVSESGASIYSASDIAREEMPDLDVTVRGAVSIGRRFQDPMAELVKIEPKSIGVGQYQHDVDQGLLSNKLHAEVESCVNRVGVELDTASAPLLSYVAGIGSRLAEAIVAHRDNHGRFASRRELLGVKGLGPRAFEQCAGFLRVRDGDDPLDASAVHPERYALVARMAKDLGVAIGRLIGDSEAVRRIDIQRYVGDDVGEPTLRDIVTELEKPGRDPRETFEPPRFRDDVHELEDLQTGMTLEGVVTNVTAFGAFVDVGVHQDGLIHVSQLADRYVKDTREEVKVGDRVRVRVLSVDLERRRISLSRKDLR